MAMDKAKGLKLASLALWALAALLALRLLLVLRGAPVPAAPAAAPAAEGESFRWPDLDAGIWNLFRSGQSAAPKSAPGALAARYRLAGVFLSLPDMDQPGAAAGERCAILDDVQARQQYLAVEKEWLKDAPVAVQVAAIGDDHVVLFDGEHEETIQLEVGTTSGPEPGPDKSAASAAPKQPILESNRFGNRIEENRWEINRQAVLEYTQEVMNSPVRTAAMFLSMDPERGADGKVVGHRLNMDFKDLDEKDKDFYKQVGLQNGDVLQRVNSVHMTNQKRAEYLIGQFAQGNLNTIVIDVERGGQPKKLIYFVK